MTKHRWETKFTLDQVQTEFLKEYLRALLLPDSHVSSQGRYPVFSCYYDTTDLDYFYHKINGEWLHVKIRLRKYAKNLLGEDPGYLEAKIKEAKDQHKLRIKIPPCRDILDPRCWLRLGSPQIAFFEQILAQQAIFPTCNVYYEREAYEIVLADGERIRMNFDSNILGLFPYETIVTEDHYHTRQILEPKTVVLEIKYHTNEFPGFVCDALRMAGVEQGAYSKYASALEALNLTIQHPEVIV